MTRPQLASVRYHALVKQVQEEQRMDKDSILTAVEGWGYRAFPRPDDGDFGYGRLLVAIRQQPTQHHFDPERLRFRLRDPQGEVRWRTASWRTPVNESGGICAGPVILTDRYDKQVEFFTFGGSVDSFAGVHTLVYAFRSPAPILEFTSPEETVSDQLACEAEGILAELEERWEEQYDKGFAERLTEIEPTTLYVAILNTVLLRYQGAPALQEAFRTLYAALEKEKRHLSMHGLWPEHPTRVQDLLFESV
jgi:hypothetical protein